MTEDELGMEMGKTLEEEKAGKTFFSNCTNYFGEEAVTFGGPLATNVRRL